MKPEVSPGVNLGNRQIESGGATKALMITELLDYGVENCPQNVLDLLVRLEEGSHFNKDARMVEKGVANVLAYLQRQGKITFSPEQLKSIALASFLADIGKAFTPAVTRLFSAENIKNQSQTVLDTIRERFPDEETNLIPELQKVGVKSDISMREFWDLHIGWTNEILGAYPETFNELVLTVAASHHGDRKLDPRNVLEKSADGKSVKIKNTISLELKYAIFTLMTVDKYQARMVRGKATHEATMHYLEGALSEYSGDPEMKNVLAVLYELGGVAELFPKEMYNSMKEMNRNEQN